MPEAMNDKPSDEMKFRDLPKQKGRDGYVIAHSPKPNVYFLMRECPFCKRLSTVEVPGEGLFQWEQRGQSVQRAFPELSLDRREQVMTGIHKDCWDVAFPDEDEYGTGVWQ